MGATFLEIETHFQEHRENHPESVAIEERLKCTSSETIVDILFDENIDFYHAFASIRPGSMDRVAVLLRDDYTGTNENVYTHFAKQIKATHDTVENEPDLNKKMELRGHLYNQVDLMENVINTVGGNPNRKDMNGDTAGSILEGTGLWKHEAGMSKFTSNMKELIGGGNREGRKQRKLVKDGMAMLNKTMS